jgi:hypothetical protein
MALNTEKYLVANSNFQDKQSIYESSNLKKINVSLLEAAC